MKERRKDTKKQKEERRHLEITKYREGFEVGRKIGFEEGYEKAKKEGAKECEGSLNGLQVQGGSVLLP